MRVEREGARVRHRSLTVASGQRAEVWLEAGAGRVALHTVQVNGSGAVYWKRCSEAGCFGAAIGSSGGCLAHVGKDERERYFHEVLSGSQALTLQGVEVTEGLWINFVDVTNGPAYFPNCSIGRDLWLSYSCFGVMRRD